MGGDCDLADSRVDNTEKVVVTVVVSEGKDHRVRE
jgi:hypothetical protein